MSDHETPLGREDWTVPGRHDGRIVHGKGGRTIKAANTARVIESFARAAKRLLTDTAAEAIPAGKARDGR